jgi:uncharacterized repeat protein (TIGR01451 family)
LAAGAAVPFLLAVGAVPAAAHESPPGCNSSSLVVTPTKDRRVVRNGDTANYTVSVANDVGSACALTGATVTLTLPAATGTPTGQVVTLGSGVDFLAGAAARVLGTVPYTVAVNAGVGDAVVEAKANGTLHDSPIDHAAQITKSLGTPVTQPHATLTKTATPVGGEAPLTVTYTYTLTNDSTTNAPISGATITDDKCSSITFTGGDANGDNLLDVGEAWTFNCTQTLRSGGTFPNIANATATNTVDNRPVPIAPAEATVTVTQSRSAILGRPLPPIESRPARRQAPCVSVPARLRVRAGELTVVRVRVQEEGRRIGGALVRITGPGFVKRAVTNAGGSVVVRVRPRRAGTLVIQSDRCLGADRVRVLGARQVTSRRVPRVTG